MENKSIYILLLLIIIGVISTLTIIDNPNKILNKDISDIDNIITIENTPNIINNTIETTTTPPQINNGKTNKLDETIIYNIPMVPIVVP